MTTLNIRLLPTNAVILILSHIYQPISTIAARAYEIALLAINDRLDGIRHDFQSAISAFPHSASPSTHHWHRENHQRGDEP